MKILTSLLLTTAVFGAGNQQIVDFVKRSGSNPNVKVKEAKVVSRSAVSQAAGWEAVRLTLSVDVKGKGETKVSDLVFTKDNLIAPELIDITKGGLKNEYQTGILPNKEMDKAHLIAGNAGAKYKVAVFSDPECPFCKDFMTDAIELATKYPTIMALYYYHFPLTAIHPDSPTLIKAMIVAKNKGVKDIANKVYRSNFDLKTNNEEEILKVFAQKTGVTITRAEISTPNVINQYEEDIALALEVGIRGTPAVFVNGIFDGRKTILDKIAKEGKK